jgi:nucleotide-binding universal stress UspA family protein
MLEYRFNERRRAMARTILLATDGSAPARNAADFAAETARCEKASVVVLGVVHPTFFGDTTEFGDQDELSREVRRAVDAEVARLSDAGISVTGRVWDDPTESVQDAVEQVAHDVDARLIVVGTHGHTRLDRALVGSVTESILRKTTFPLMAVPPTAVPEKPLKVRTSATGAKATV